VAMMLRHSFGMSREAGVVEKAVRLVLKDGFRTVDIRQKGATIVGTKEMGDRVAEQVGVLMQSALM
jgi:3-isopropylmalate dehydrogenase